MSLEKIDDLNHTLHALEHAISILHADEATHMPAGGGEQRAEAVATLSSIVHQKASAPEIADWIAQARTGGMDPDREIGLNEFARLYKHLTCLPSKFVRTRTRTSMVCEQLWRELRPAGDWKSFAPALTEVVLLVREEAAMRSEATGLSPYDAMMEQYDPGNRSADIDPIFARLKAFLKDFIPEVIEIQQQRHKEQPLKYLTGSFGVDKQRALGLTAMAAVGFDFTHGRLDTSHHPFCGGVPSDVRMTTRYDSESFLPGLMGVLHETGHALYEQGLLKKNAHWPHNKARGMGVHESQSLFVEMQLARSPQFWTWIRPMVQTHLGAEVFAGWSIEDILAHVNLVRRGLIRVDADELTYPLHVILRYELEQGLVTGALSVNDIPEAWHAKMQQYLGLGTIDNMKDGPMQDVHWPAGLFGYFPSYTLGAMMAAQQFAALKKQLPDTLEQIERGDFSAINQWRKDNIWLQGARWSTPELMRRATGEPLNPQYFINHLKQRYLGQNV